MGREQLTWLAIASTAVVVVVAAVRIVVAERAAETGARRSGPVLGLDAALAGTLGVLVVMLATILLRGLGR